MGWIDWLRRLGVLRWGARSGTYTSGADRPVEFMMDGVFDGRKDLVPAGTRRDACPRCGAPLRPGNSFCASCGSPAATAAASSVASRHRSPSVKTSAIGCLAGGLVAAGLVGVLLLVGHLVRSRAAKEASTGAVRDATVPAAAARGAVKPPAKAKRGPSPPAVSTPPLPSGGRPGATSPAATTLTTMPVPAGVRFRRMDNPRFGYQVELPAHWVSEVRDDAQVFSGPQGQADHEVTLNVQVIRKSPGGSIRAQADEIKHQWARMSDYALHGERETELRGRPTVFLMAVFRPQGEGVYEQAQVIVDRAPYYYWIGYTTPRPLFDGHLWVLNHALNTFDFTPIGK
jgi:hypothetical protein